MKKFIYYQHHAGRRKVWVDETLLGMHKQHCLCYNCKAFKPYDREKNCIIANAVYSLNVLANITTPVWECPEFEPKES